MAAGSIYASQLVNAFEQVDDGLSRKPSTLGTEQHWYSSVAAMNWILFGEPHELTSEFGINQNSDAVRAFGLI